MKIKIIEEMMKSRKEDVSSVVIETIFPMNQYLSYNSGIGNDIFFYA